MNQNSYLYKSMAKYRKKFLLCYILAIAGFVAFVLWQFPYLKTQMTGATALDTDKMLSQIGTMTVPDKLELDRHEPTQPETSLYALDDCYRQGRSYLFKVPLGELEETGIVYSTDFEISENNYYTYDSAEVLLTQIGDKKFVVLTTPDKKIGKTTDALLVKSQRPVIASLSQWNEGKDKLVIADYFVDCRGIDVGAQSTDIVIFIIYLVVLLYLGIKLGVYYAKPKTTPTFRQLKRYGNIDDVAEQIENQLNSDGVYQDGKELVVDDFILSDAAFKTKVVRNHMKKN